MLSMFHRIIKAPTQTFRHVYHTMVRGGLQKYTVTLKNQTGHPEVFRKQHQMFLERVVDPVQLFYDRNKFMFVGHEAIGVYHNHVYTFYIHVDEIPEFEQRLNNIIDTIQQTAVKSVENDLV